MSELLQFWQYLSKKRQIQYVFLLVLMMLSSLAEMVSIGAVMPLLSVLMSPENLYQKDFIQPVIIFLELTEADELRTPVVSFFIIAVTVAAVIRVALLYSTFQLQYKTGTDVSLNIYKRTLDQDYLNHINRNSSEVVSAIFLKTNLVIGGLVGPCFAFISSFLMSLCIITILVIVNTSIIFYAFIFFAAVYGFIIFYLRKKVKINGEIIAENTTLMLQHLQEGLGGIKDIILDDTQEFYCNQYYKSLSLRQNAAAINAFYGASPKPVIETVGILCIALFSYYLSNEEGGIERAIPMLAALTLGAQRLLPAMQLLYGSYTSIKASKPMLIDLLFLLNQKVTKHTKISSAPLITFEKEILISNLSFRYSKEEPWVLKDLSIRLKKNTTVGFVGTTGSGKSTLINIIMGLLDPSEGYIAVDGKVIEIRNKKSWQAHIAHVPQDIFLADGTIEENIAFGIPPEKIDHYLVREVAKKANILDLIESTKYGYQTNVGEEGAKISGGQRQRIGIARALYKKCDVLVLDEATSSLDNGTEKQIMKEVSALSGEMTILIIAHRLSTLENCDELIDISNW